MALTILTGLDGVVSLVPHASMPGVLVRVETTYGVQSVRVVRSVEGGPWEPVLSGDPTRLMPDGGVRSAHAFDLAATPGRRVAYTVQFSPDEPPLAKYAVSIRLPELEQDRSWIKPLSRPMLSRKVFRIEDGPMRSTSGWATEAPVYGSSSPHMTLAGRSRVAQTLTLLVPYDRVEIDATMEAVTAPGPILYQAQTSLGPYEQWLAWTGAAIDEVTDLDRAGWRRITVPVVEVAAPATRESRMVIPGATYEDLSRDARTWTEYSTEFPSSFDALLAACGQPYGDARTDSPDEGLRVDP